MAWGNSDLCTSVGQIIIYVACIPFYLSILVLEWLLNYFAPTRLPIPKNVLVTGATSGIGRSIALHYASRGARMVAITGRRKEHLKAVALEIAALGAIPVYRVADVTNRQEIKDWIYELDTAHPLDLVIANAGVSESIPGIDAMDDLERASYAVADVNITGVMNTVLPAVACMRGRGAGQIAITSSMAAHGTYLPITPSYSASKAWELSWGLGLRAQLWTTGIRVNVLCPGFVDTQMPRSVPAIIKGIATGAPATADQLPFMVSPARIAEIFAEGLARDQAIVTYPQILFLFGNIFYKAPWPVQDFLIRATTSGTLNVWGHSHPQHVPTLPDKASPKVQ